MRWALIRNADNAWLSGPLDEDPTPGEGERKEVVPLEYPVSVTWSQPDGGFVDKVVATSLISVGRFKLLFTQDERFALRAASKTDPRVEDFLDLLAGFTEGVSLTHPVMIDAIGQLVTGGLLTAERGAAILAGGSAE